VPIQGNGKMLQINVSAQHQKQYGMKQFNNVNAHLVYTDQNVSNVPFQGNGIIIQILAIAQLLRQFGTT